MIRLAAAAAALVIAGCEGGESAQRAGTGGAGGNAQGSGGQAGGLSPGGTGGAGAISSTFTADDYGICVWPDCPPGIISPNGTGQVVNRSCKTEVAPGHVIAAKCGGCIDKATCLPFVGRCRAPSWAVFAGGTVSAGAVGSAAKLDVPQCQALLARTDFVPLEVAPGIPSYATCTGDVGADTGTATLVCCSTAGAPDSCNIAN